MIDHITGKATLTRIELIVSPKGETTLVTKGFAGSSCREASRFVEEALGQRVGERLTAEFHQTPQGQTIQPQQI